MAVTDLRPDLHVVAADHPSLDRDIVRFLADLRAEPRYFGPSARANPKPFPSLITALAGHGGFRLAVVERGRVIGLVRVDGGGEVAIAVAADRRGRGVGTRLCEAALERALGLDYARLVIRSTYRSRAIHRIGASLGCLVVDHGRGRTDLILDVAASSRSA